MTWWQSTLGDFAARLGDANRATNDDTVRTAVELACAAVAKLQQVPGGDRYGGCTVASLLLRLARDELRACSPDANAVPEFPDPDPADDPAALLGAVARLIAGARRALERNAGGGGRLGAVRFMAARHLAAAERMLRLETGGASRVR